MSTPVKLTLENLHVLACGKRADVELRLLTKSGLLLPWKRNLAAWVIFLFYHG